MGESHEGTPLGDPIGEIHWEFRVTSLGEHIAAFLTLLPCVGNVIDGFLSLWIRVQAECCNCPPAKQSRITVCLVSTMSSRYPVFMTDNALQ